MDIDAMRPPAVAAQPKPIRVSICDPEHPHYPESGELTGEVIMLLGTPMAKLRLDSCRHGVDGCFIKKGQVQAERRKRT
jgi:hypothetical protein